MTKHAKLKQLENPQPFTTLDGEIFRPIPNCSCYFVSDKGNIMTFKKDKPKIMSPGKLLNGYLMVNLFTTDNVRKQMYIHRLVLLAWSNHEPSSCINHKDGDKTNNNLSNLEYCSQSYNIAESHRTNPRTRVFKRQVTVHTNEASITYQTIKSTAKALNVTPGAVYNACTGRQKTCAGFKMEYTINLDEN